MLPNAKPGKNNKTHTFIRKIRPLHPSRQPLEFHHFPKSHHSNLWWTQSHGSRYIIHSIPYKQLDTPLGENFMELTASSESLWVLLTRVLLLSVSAVKPRVTLWPSIFTLLDPPQSAWKNGHKQKKHVPGSTGHNCQMAQLANKP